MIKERILYSVILLLFLFTAPALAHKVQVFAYYEAGEVHTESYFNDGKPCVNSKIIVYSPGGEVYTEGVSDEEGMFSFPVDIQGNLNIVLEASMGHRAEINLEIKDIAGAEKNNEEAAPGVSEENETEPDSASVADRCFSQRELDEYVESRVNKRTTDNRNEMKKLGRPAFRDIVAGLGYLTGIMGLWLFALSAKKRAGSK
ncbi:MAG TPA: hypothetical protein PLN69_00795 [bacterium]|nr:hypothetical protein [bacterium]